jgi:hypothetical protein
MTKSGEHNLYVKRDTQVVPYSMISQVGINPENVCILFSQDIKAYPLDFGSVAYSKRISVARSTSIKDWCAPVVVESLVTARRELLFGVFDLLGRYKNPVTGRNICSHIMRILGWCDERNFTLVFIDASETSRVYRDYTDFLNGLILSNLITPQSANSLQRSFSTLCKISFPDNYLSISSSAPAIKAIRRTGMAPSEVRVAHYIKCCLSVARGFSRAVIDFTPFPWVINFEEFEAVIFPANSGCYTPFTGRPNHSHNVDSRRIATLEEYLISTGRDGRIRSIRYDIQATLNNAVENLLRANTDAYSEYRLRLATVALRAYATLIIAVTGCSPSELVQFDYDEALEIEKSLVKKELSAVKLRARGRKTRYALGKNNGLVILREFIELRNWLLQGRSFEKLFFQYEVTRERSRGGIKALSVTVTYLFHEYISGRYLNPTIPALGSRLMRRHKSVILHSMGFSPQVVADALNHRVSTNIVDYAGATSDQQNREMGLFWTSIRKASTLVRDRRSEDSMSIAAGHCDSFGSPSSVGVEVEIVPDCKTQFGCLFCERYVCHADEEDTHKLLSLQYVINAIRRVSPDPDHSERLFQKLSMRLQYILREISGRSTGCAELVDKLNKRVHELGDLTPFWESRLQRYEKLGVIF